MPTYEYACKQCGEHVEVVQSFYDDPLTTCDHCGGELRKVFGNIGIVFKGSGFYKTDSRSSQPKSSASVSSADSKDTSATATAGSGDDATATAPEKKGSGQTAASTTPSKDTPAPTPSSSTKGSDSAA
jgi:putative FmdB family regulatory protein